MRAFRVVAIALIVLGVSSFMTAAPPVYPLRIQGGGPIRVSLARSRTSSTKMWVIVDFQFGTRRAGAGLRPGQGSWLDRGMRAGEPTRLDYEAASVSEAHDIQAFLRMPGSETTFECYNSGKGYMLATKVTGRSQRID